MSVKEITGLMTILPDRENKNQSIKEDLQAGNIAFRSRTIARTIQFWDTNSGGSNYGLGLYPFKQGGLLDDLDITVGHNGWNSAGVSVYPSAGTGTQSTLSTLDYSKFRATGSIPTIASTLISRVHAGIAAVDNLAGAGDNAWGGNQIVSASDLPADYTQIGIVYPHPMTVAAGTIATAVGSSYVTIVNGGWWDQFYITPTKFGVLRIATGADAGFYFIHSVDFLNNKIFLRNLNGTPFVGQAAATIAATELYLGPGRTSYFNEVSIIQFSTGLMVAGGRYNPGFFAGTTQPLRTSFILKVKIEKTGSTEVASAAEQQGSYVIGLRPWTHGEYDYNNLYDFAMYRSTPNEGNSTQFPGHTFPYSGFGGGGSNAMLLDEANQRCWVPVTNAANDSAILHWRWRTLESPREVANYLGTAGHASFLTPTPVLATGDRIRGGTIDSKQWVYFAVQHPTLGNGGIIIIKPNLTTLQYTENLGGSAWTGTGDTIGGTAPNMTLTDSAATFNAGQVGQSITISGAAANNNGTFLITGYTSPTVITYQNHAGTGETVALTWTILGVPDSNVAAVVADRTRTRIGTAGDVSTNGSNQLTSASGAFTASDIGRVIKLTGLTGSDNGVYLIATQGGTTATVTTLAGATVTFTTQTGGTFEISDRIYQLYNNGTTGLNKINYSEVLAPGTFLSRTFSSTAGLGANCNVQAIHGENQRAAIDPANGNLYWLSNDTTQQINKYNVATNAHTAILITDSLLLAPAGGVVNNTASPATNPGTPTIFTAILVNSKFDEIWVGSDQGIFKIVKSTFAAATIKRYYGNESQAVLAGVAGNYFTGTPLTTGTGNGTTGLSVSGINVTLNATGTPFVASDVGKYVIITGSTTAANNGVYVPTTGIPFLITAFNSSSQIVFTNASGVTQASYAGTFYIVSSFAQRSDGSFSSGSNSRITRNFWEHPDGKVQASMWPGNTTNHDSAVYSREADTFVFRAEQVGSQVVAAGRNKVFDSVGWCWDFCYNAGNAASRMFLSGIEVHYQWTGSAWTPKEHAYAGTPNKSFADTTNTLMVGRPIHSTMEDVLYGVKVRFDRQGGATPANNEFLGRMGQTRITAGDGATTLGAATFDGSGFVSGDTGRVIRVETGVDAGIYKATFVNAGQLTLKNMNGSTFSAVATAGTLTYTVWDFGQVASNAGPEEMTLILADGVSKDNTQDITGFTYEAYHFKTRLHENDESRKFCVENPLAPPGSLATKSYFENYPRATAQYDAGSAHHLALPSVEVVNGRQAFDGIIGKYMDSVGGHGFMYSNQGSVSPTQWFGTLADTNIMGWSLMADFGADVQVGYAILRVHCFTTDNRLIDTISHNGLRANIYKINNIQTATGTATISGTAPNMTLTAPGAVFTALHVGRSITISGATTPANNGTFLITSFTSATVIGYTNAAGVAEALPGTWTFGSTNGSFHSRGVGVGAGGITGTAPTMTLTSTGTPFSAADIGKSILITGAATAANNGLFPILSSPTSASITYTNASGVAATYSGNWYVVPAPNVRTSGLINFSVTANTTTATATTGDFLGPITLTPTTPTVGAIVSGGSILTDTTNAQFLPSHVGQILKVTAGPAPEIGSYRIIGFTSSSIITVRNLDQTAKTWGATSSVIAYEVRDGVRAEDLIISGAHRLCVERLLTATTLQLRTGPNATITAQNWTCLKPAWDLVKRISHSTEALPPDVKNNGSWVTSDGRNIYDFGDAEVYSDFSDLASAARTGRYWKFTAIPRFDTDNVRSDHDISTWEFYDIAGKRISTSNYTMVDQSRVDVNADFLFTHVNRIDYIQAANDALSGVATFNGNVNLGGAGGDTLTLTTGGNKFLGFQIGTALTDGNPIFGGNTFNSAGSSFPAAATAGRFLWIQTGVNTGFYRILSRVSATQITVGPPSGVGSTVFGPGGGPSETGQTFSIHEGINVGGVSADKFVFLEDNREFTLLTINDALTSITFSETLQPVRTNKTWEIRRPGYDTASTTTEATKTARLTRPGTTPGPGTYPVQSGDMCHDSLGTYRFFSEDIGAGFQRADGVIAGGNGNLTGSGFSSDDVGRLLYITTGVNLGIYEIDLFTSATAVRVKNHYTGAAVSFTADAGPVTYQIYGDRRFKLTRFVVGLRA